MSRAATRTAESTDAALTRRLRRRTKQRTPAAISRAAPPAIKGAAGIPFLTVNPALTVFPGAMTEGRETSNVFFPSLPRSISADALTPVTGVCPGFVTETDAVSFPDGDGPEISIPTSGPAAETHVADNAARQKRKAKNRRILADGLISYSLIPRAPPGGPPSWRCVFSFCFILPQQCVCCLHRFRAPKAQNI